MEVDKSAIDTAIMAHAEWKKRILAAIQTGKSDFKVETVRVDNACNFGKWLYSLPKDIQNTPEHKKVKDLHAAFHKVAAEVLEMAVSGKKAEAEKNIGLGGAYNLASGRLILALNDWKKKL